MAVDQCMCISTVKEAMGDGEEGGPDVKRVGMGEERFISKEAEVIKKSQLQCSSDISELRIRVSYERILRIRVCHYAHIYEYIRTHIRAYMSLCYAFP